MRKNSKNLLSLNTSQNNAPNKEESAARSWIIVLAISGIFMIWGLLVYFAVGVSWPPPWRYGTIADVPGQSVYSVSGAEKAAGMAPLEEEKVRRQHVMGQGEENAKLKDKGGL